ncbi:MAG: hypothetical protein K2X86_02880 [Cytophagaceae bacterium]|nr:hypothetical protein [Cytophagaceae bacterium]
MKLFLTFIFAFLSLYSVSGQTVRKTFEGADLDSSYFARLQEEYGRKKKLPENFEKQTLLALSYFPELKDVKINFRVRRKTSPLMVRPTVGSTIFRSAKKRTYIIFISCHSPKVDSILMKNLTLDAQVGVVGHELSHVSFFITQGRFGMFKVAIGNLSWKYLDKIEFETDRSTIQHGLGWQLLTWSEFVRVKLKMEKWRGADEYIKGKSKRPKARYMNPETIKAVMADNPIYQSN